MTLINRFSNFQLRLATTILGLCGLFFLYYYGNTSALLALIVGCAYWILYNEMPHLYDHYHIGYLVLSLVYIGIPTLMLISFAITPQYHSLLLPLCILTFTNDASAYVSGTLFGKHKLFPQISPKKSIEGAIGAYLATGIMLGIFINKITQENILFFIILSVSISTLAILGDFFESYLKRAAGIKDTGTLLPGHGGLLDRVDAILFVTVLFYFLRDKILILLC